MNQSTLASAFAAAQPRFQPAADSPRPAALDAQVLLNAVRRSLQSCRDVSTYRTLLLNLGNAAEESGLSQGRPVA